MLFLQMKIIEPKQMKIENNAIRPTLHVIGISHKRADATIRGGFSLSPNNKRNILNIVTAFIASCFRNMMWQKMPAAV